MLQQELDEYYARFRVSNNLLELRNLVQVAELIVRCAMLRKESRGLHYTSTIRSRCLTAARRYSRLT